MNLQFLIFFLLFLILPNDNTIYAENIKPELENSSNTIENYRVPSDSKIRPPDFARTPPIPQIEISEIPTHEENPYYYLVWIVIGIITIIIILKLKKRKSQKN